MNNIIVCQHIIYVIRRFWSYLIIINLKHLSRGQITSAFALLIFAYFEITRCKQKLFDQFHNECIIYEILIARYYFYGRLVALYRKFANSAEVPVLKK